MLRLLARSTRSLLGRELHQQAVEQFTELLGGRGVTTDPVALSAHNLDWTKVYQGDAKVVLSPSCTEEVSKVLAYCNQHNISVVPQGGNTGLVGGGIAFNDDEVILSLSRMNQILGFEGGVVVAESGCILEALDEYARVEGFRMPLDLGAKGSCQIGGNIATNAGGLRFLRYGSLRANTLGLEVVLADGTVLDCLKTLRKDNTGYDLKQLFIGSEGTLGVITKAAVKCVPTSTAVNTLLMQLDSFQAVEPVFKLASKHLAEVLSAFEFMDGHSMRLALKHVHGAVNPFSDVSNMYVLVETAGSNDTHDMAKLEAFVEECSELPAMHDAVIAQDSLQTQNIWKIREGIPEGVIKHGRAHKYDFSLPLPQMYALVEDVRELLGDISSDIYVCGYGHFGDGNLHLNVADGRSNRDDVVKKVLEPYVFEWCAQHAGSISAEHGLGVQKRDVIHYSQPPEAIQLMGRLKCLLDPKNTLNPNKVLAEKLVESSHKTPVSQYA